MRIEFSEPLKSMEDLKEEFGGRLLNENFIEITYINNINSDCVSTSPDL